MIAVDSFINTFKQVRANRSQPRTTQLYVSHNVTFAMGSKITRKSP